MPFDNVPTRSAAAMDRRVRRAAKAAGWLVLKPVFATGYALVHPQTKAIVKGDRFDLTPQQAITFCENTSSMSLAAQFLDHCERAGFDTATEVIEVVKAYRWRETDADNWWDFVDLLGNYLEGDA